MSHSWTSLSIDCTFSLEDQEDEEAALRSALERICAEAVAASKSGHQIIVLSDRLAGFSRIPIPALLSLGSVHQSLIQSRERNRVALFVETGEAREIHHLALLLGFGADAINPYLVFETMSKRKKGSSEESIFDSYRRAVKTGLLKVMAKMGISSLQSYKGAQIFEAVGLSRDVIDVAFSSTASRVGGASFGDIAREAVERHSLAFRLDRDCWSGARNPGLLHWRAGGEAHVNEPMAVALLQEAAKSNSIQAYHKYVEWSREACRKTTLRGQLKIKYPSEGIAVEDVTDSVTDIMRRFCTGAMSYGSISKEAHEALAVAMNR
jgi:glutamate synthase (NADPH/NADH)